MAHVFGYAVGLDLTRRDLQGEAKKKGHPWEVGKSFEASAPIGLITPAAQAGDIATGRIALTVNGTLRQQSPIADLIWSVAEVIAKLSRQVAVGAGDLIYTGTPEGVAAIARGRQVAGRNHRPGAAERHHCVMGRTGLDCLLPRGGRKA